MKKLLLAGLLLTVVINNAIASEFVDFYPEVSLSEQLRKKSSRFDTIGHSLFTEEDIVSFDYFLPLRIQGILYKVIWEDKYWNLEYRGSAIAVYNAENKVFSSNSDNYDEVQSFLHKLDTSSKKNYKKGQVKRQRISY
ncbi:MAG: hypothetical protein AB8G05_27190 [Oligoflexales bacterium]